MELVWTLATSLAMAPAGPPNCQCGVATLAKGTNMPGLAITSCLAVTLPPQRHFGTTTWLLKLGSPIPSEWPDAPANQPTLTLGWIPLAFHMPMFRQHLAGQNEEIQEHVTIFDVVHENAGGQTQLGELADAVIGHPEFLREFWKHRVLAVLAESENRFLGLVDQEEAVGTVEFRVIELRELFIVVRRWHRRRYGQQRRRPTPTRSQLSSSVRGG